MRRFLARALPTALMVGSLFVGAAPARGDDEMPTEGASPETKTIQWVDGYAAASEAAKKSGRIMFVYFGRHNPG